MSVLSPRSVELLEGLQNLQGDADDIRGLLQDQQSGRRIMHDMLLEVIGDLSTIIPAIQQERASLGSAMGNISTQIERMLEGASTKQKEKLQELKRIAGTLDPNMDTSNETITKLRASIDTLKRVLSEEANIPPPPPPQGGRRRRRKGGYTYRKTKTRSTRTRRSRK